MILWFLIKTFFHFVGIIVATVFNLFAVMAKGLIMLLSKWIHNSIERSNEKKQSKLSIQEKKLIGQKVTEEPETLEEVPILEPLDIQTKTDDVAYAIVRREDDGTWVQSVLVTTYEEARQILEKERAKSRAPRMIRKIYL